MRFLDLEINNQETENNLLEILIKIQIKMSLNFKKKKETIAKVFLITKNNSKLLMISQKLLKTLYRLCKICYQIQMKHNWGKL